MKSWGKKKKKQVGDTMHVRSFGKWRQHRLSDGVDYPVVTYNNNNDDDANFNSLASTTPRKKQE